MMNTKASLQLLLFPQPISLPHHILTNPYEEEEEKTKHCIERERGKKKTTLQLYMLSHKPISLSKFLNQIKKKVRERKEPLTKQMYTKREGIPQGGLESMQYSRS